MNGHRRSEMVFQLTKEERDKGASYLPLFLIYTVTMLLNDVSKF